MESQPLEVIKSQYDRLADAIHSGDSAGVDASLEGLLAAVRQHYSPEGMARPGWRPCHEIHRGLPARTDSLPEEIRARVRWAFSATNEALSHALYETFPMASSGLPAVTALVAEALAEKRDEAASDNGTLASLRRRITDMRASENGRNSPFGRHGPGERVAVMAAAAEKAALLVSGGELGISVARHHVWVSEMEAAGGERKAARTKAMLEEAVRAAPRTGPGPRLFA